MNDFRVSFIPMVGEPVVDREIELLGQVDVTQLLSVREPGVHRKQKHIPGSQLQDLALSQVASTAPA